jgi:Domain of unknown function (DUF1848)
MLISASYKTDIPAFYGEWFMNRLDAGYCLMRNPYNRNVTRIELTKQAVDGFVFWTKNLGPFLPSLAEVKHRGFPFMVQYTINGYPRALEVSVLEAAKATEHVRAVTEQFGRDSVVWRYDTILLSSLTPVEFHLDNFGRIAASLRGYTNECVISFAQIYRKTKRNLDRAAADEYFTWREPTGEERRVLLQAFLNIAKQNGMALTICSQPEFASDGVAESHCIDAQRLSHIAGRTIAAKLKGMRETCGCYQSKDIGDYDTCPHGCVYCYAVQNRELARRRYSQHDATAELLWPH